MPLQHPPFIDDAAGMTRQPGRAVYGRQPIEGMDHVFATHGRVIGNASFTPAQRPEVTTVTSVDADPFIAHAQFYGRRSSATRPVDVVGVFRFVIPDQAVGEVAFAMRNGSLRPPRLGCKMLDSTHAGAANWTNLGTRTLSPLITPGMGLAGMHSALARPDAGTPFWARWQHTPAQTGETRLQVEFSIDNASNSLTLVYVQQVLIYEQALTVFT